MSEKTNTSQASAKGNVIKILSGITVFAVMLFIGSPEGMSHTAWATAAVGVLMAVWWITEAVPIEATALLPLVLFPLLGVSTMKEAAAHFANPVVFLLFGGFMIAVAMEKWNLHRRIALTILKIAGVRPCALIAGFMASTAFLSMWVSNTATAAMMLPIAMSVIKMLEKDEDERNNFGIALLLSIAYSASIGGVATLIGTPPNALFAGFMLDNYGIAIGFNQWIIVGLPVSLTLLVFTWFSLTKLSFPMKDINIEGAKEVVEKEIAGLGKMSCGEKGVAFVFFLTAVSWLFRKQIDSYFVSLNITDAGIAVTAAVLMFLIPADYKKGVFLLDWSSAKKLSWGVLILVGGGLSLGSAITSTGLSGHLAEAMSSLENIPPMGLIVVFILVVTLVSHMTSNTATAAAFLPLAASVAIGFGQNPMLLAVPTAIAASCVFMMPVATPPNAIVFSSGMIKIPQMVKAGLYINIAAMVVLLIVAYCLLGVAFGVEVNVLPKWAVANYN
ncbi:MAG: DASS family sodium-coupled anion symporter [Alphaproteobacteria bacterium]|nr:DASS family sodium-coupled anion symporter [Alphaproteobacteria bacterium]